MPFFNAPRYLHNKTQIRKVDEIFGPIKESVSSLNFACVLYLCCYLSLINFVIYFTSGMIFLSCSILSINIMVSGFSCSEQVIYVQKKVVDITIIQSLFICSGLGFVWVVADGFVWMKLPI